MVNERLDFRLVREDAIEPEVTRQLDRDSELVTTDLNAG